METRRASRKRCGCAFAGSPFFYNSGEDACEIRLCCLCKTLLKMLITYWKDRLQTAYFSKLRGAIPGKILLDAEKWGKNRGDFVKKNILTAHSRDGWKRGPLRYYKQYSNVRAFF